MHSADAQTCPDEWRAEIVSPQGPVEIRRAGTADWLPVQRGDSICTGDSVRVLRYGRALLALPDATSAWLDEGTVVTFLPSQDENRSVLDVILGIIFFISRDPVDVAIETPFADAGIEGTEFVVAVTNELTTVTVFEGLVRVANTAGTVVIGSLERATARAGQAPVVEPLTVRPLDAVQWALHYDSILSAPLPAPDDDATPAQLGDPGYLSGRAAARLDVGRVDEAGDDLDRALQADPDHAETLALMTVIALTQNRKGDARELADRAVAENPESAAALIAQSFARQADFDVPAARDSLETAVALEPRNAAAWARLAELRLADGDVDGSVDAAEMARALSPALPRALTVLGFANLSRLAFDEARETFREAIELDEVAPLAHFGLGLALIRAGELTAGREELELGVMLDPGNALLRSYIGKAYYDERRHALSASELAAAKELDPLDPTAFFYDAIRKQSLNRPIEALSDLEQSIDLNDNRAVYRSQFLLDDDFASRSASIGRIYTDLGFDQLALLNAGRSLDADPANHSAHRLLADTYASMPRSEIVRVNEVLQSQLLQPLNVTPVPPQLGEANLFILDTAGPAEIGFNEFNPLFNRNRAAVHASGVVGANDTRGGNVVVSGVLDRWAYSIGYFGFETDGFRENNDLDQEVGNAFFQVQASEKTSVVVELRSAEREQGDLRLLFDPERYVRSLRRTEDTRSIRLGLRHSLSPGSDLVASLVGEDAELSTRVGSSFMADSAIDTYAAEIQHLLRGRNVRLTSGARRIERDGDDSIRILTPVPFPPFEIEVTDDARFDTASSSLYSYASVDIASRVSLTVGASVQDIDGRQFAREQLNPKLGIDWQPTTRLSVRAGSFRTLQFGAYSRQDILPLLEPTQITGFRQFIAGSEGESVWNHVLGIDYRFTETLDGGLRLVERDLEIPFRKETGPPDFELIDLEADSDEQIGSVFVYWTPTPRIALRAEYQDERFRNDPLFTPEGFVTLNTRRLPIELNFYLPGGISLGATATRIDQQGMFDAPNPPLTPFSAGDDFWVLDASLRYRFANRRGIVSLNVLNLLDEQFRYQDRDPENPRVFPDRFALLRFTVAY